MDAIAAAAEDAPGTPGVYFMLTADRELVYIGKAGHLRRRLQQHAKAAAVGTTTRDVLRAATVADVRWQQLPTEQDAADREADLIVALLPTLNGSLASDGRWTFVDLQAKGATSTVTLTTDAASKVHGRRFGCFPHLGPGGGSRRSDACTSGLAAVLRLLWSATAGDERASCPAAIAGASVRGGSVTCALPMVDGVASGLTRLLSGTGDAVIGVLHEEALSVRPRVAHPALHRDAEQARAFFQHGPRAIRDLRRRHGLDATALTREAFAAALTAEVTELVGPFRVMGADPSVDRVVGARRGRAIAQRSRRLM